MGGFASLNQKKRLLSGKKPALAAMSLRSVPEKKKRRGEKNGERAVGWHLSVRESEKCRVGIGGIEICPETMNKEGWAHC